VLQILPPTSPVVALLDDTLIRKRGHRIAGTSWQRDPLGPHFADNFIWASRFLQISRLCPSIPGRPPVRPALSPSICYTPLRRANPRAVPMPSTRKRLRSNATRKLDPGATLPVLDEV